MINSSKISIHRFIATTLFIPFKFEKFILHIYIYIYIYIYIMFSSKLNVILIDLTFVIDRVARKPNRSPITCRNWAPHT